MSSQGICSFLSSGVARKTSRISWAPSGWFITYDVPDVATSFHMFTCADDFYAARLGFVNVSQAPFTVKKVVGTTSTSLNDPANPTDGAQWVPFTFANKGADDDALVTSSDAPTEIIVAAASAERASSISVVPRWKWSDWVPIVSRRRTDQPDLPRIMLVRALLPGGDTITQPNGGFNGYFGERSVNFGFDYGAGWLPDDFVSQPCRLIPDVASANFGTARATIACVQFATKNRGLVGMITGDSHQQGTSTTTQFLNCLLRSTIALGARQMANVPLGYVSTAAGGTTSEQFFSAVTSLLSAVQPGFVILPGWTYNDRGQEHGDQTSVDIFIARLIKAADACILSGSIPIFLTPFPRGHASMTPVQLEPWRKLRSVIMDMGRSGAIVLDATSILGQRTSDGLFDGSYLPELSTDEVHPNDAGHAALSRQLMPIIARLAGIVD